MAREIKFRAWNNERMTYKPIVGDGTNGREAAEVWLNDALSLSDEVLMQYTGCKDKNGAEVHEGDIVTDKHMTKGVVKYVQSDAAFKIVSDDDRLFFLTSDIDGLTVIGNIYENPELLGGK